MNTPQKKPSPAYIGRFAPSPTGPLHIGSLIGAVASYLDARAHSGHWHVRMEDLDPPREPPAAAQTILHCLQSHGLKWDGEVLWQSQRHNAYQQALNKLLHSDHAFACSCSRSQLQANQGLHRGVCRADTTQACAIRVRAPSRCWQFDDRIQGPYSQQLDTDVGDFVIRRKDGLFAYQLAVVVDDAFMGINQVLRGSDLLDSTARQIYLQQLLALPTPTYTHFPVISDALGEKLSKQNRAPALELQSACDNLRYALRFLGQQAPPDSADTPASLLAFATIHWCAERIPKALALTEQGTGFACSPSLK